MAVLRVAAVVERRLVAALRTHRRREEPRQPPPQRIDALEFALPHHDHAPAQTTKRLAVGLIAIDVLLQLQAPILDARCRHDASPARVPMPKAAVDEDDRTVLPQDDVGDPRQRPIVQPKAETEPMKDGAHGHLGSRVSRPNSGHDLAASLYRNLVHT